MFCPYAVNRHTVQQTVFEYNEDGSMRMSQIIDHNNAEFIKCKEQECGAWRDGKCCYQNSG